MTTGPRQRWHRRATPPRPGYIPGWSMPAVARWCYFRLLATLLRPFPHPVYRAPATLLAAARILYDGEARKLNRALVDACGQRVTAWWIWRIHWQRAYRREADLLLLIQSRRLTRAWAAAHVRVEGTIPAGGAILIAVHHARVPLGSLALAEIIGPLGTIARLPPDDPALLTAYDPTLRAHWRYMKPLKPRINGGSAFTPRDGARRGLRLLRAGGYLSLYTDDYTGGTIPCALLGRAWWLPRGPLWFAAQSGKPIVPWMVVPHGGGYKLVIGDPIEATPEAIVAAMEMCIRRAPGCWERSLALAWLRHELIVPATDA